MSTKPVAPKLRKKDRPEVNETFADTLGLSMWDGQTLKIELCVIRWDEPRPPSLPSGEQVVAARLVLSAKCAVELLNQLTQLGSALQQAGIIHQNPPPTPMTRN